MNTISKGFQQEQDLNDIVVRYAKRWYWFLLTIIILLGAAYIYNRYAVPKYDISAKIQILEEKGASSELAVFKDLDFLGGKQNEVEDEIEVLNSRSNFIEVVKNLKANVTFSQVGDIKESEIYNKVPVNINFLSPDSLLFNAKHIFYIELTSKSNFKLRNKEDELPKIYSFGKNISTPVGDVIITPNIQFFNAYEGEDIKIVVNPITAVAQNFKKMVKISTIDEFSKILTLSIEHPIPEKGIGILNELVNVYNTNAVLDKKEIADRTFKFINERISDIYSNLATVDQTAQEFKTDRGLADLQSQANINLNVGAATQQELENYRNQLNIASAMKEIVTDQNDTNETLPSNIGISDPSIANSTAKYNQLLQERNRLLKSSNDKNPVIVGLNEELQSIKNGLAASLGAMENNLSLTVNNLSKQQSRINSKIYSAPKNERALRDITRKQETTESLYLYLLQRREESQVALASTAPKSKVIDSAYLTDERPISPNKFKIYLASFLLGFIIPFSILYAHNLMDNKVHSKSMLEKVIGNYPVLAELPSVDKKSQKYIHEDDRSVLAESLRILRTNLDYLIKSKNSVDRNNVVLVTSSVSGEGKTFISSNLSMIFSSTKKKVLLIGADIRNPKLTDFFKEDKNVDILGKAKKNNKLGLSEYLMDHSIETDDLIKTMLVHNNTIDVIYSGKILPNPSELLMGDRFKNLIEEVSQKYDYVIIDSAPLMVVTDTLLISPYANHTIYVTRAHVTETKVVDFPISLQKEGKLVGLNFVVNDVKESNLGYGGKYGYGYGIKTKKWWQVFS
ncbi:polysaccharide biosynthesis tyrosine autokinase [Maribacter confluentis]|uniref:non-specific protein-tyrosine kinase n=1 Tax=Maribacter confluentis TaxID=1656093 RepID=A0ABT8RV13_9FLAO|nr:tyrosine-protein kinase family protein [Maribacter confluentis]MDO1514332.1 polysaccharide biosynthesis tyrosine autokinase [Maribacter confluentis]